LGNKALFKMIKVGIVGISGYSGYKAISILLKHPDVRVTYISANNTQGRLDVIWPQFKGQSDLFCETYDPAKAMAMCDVIFLALPHTVSMKITPDLLRAGKRVIDLSGDYRLRPARKYQEWYGAVHSDPRNLSKAVYGLPEIFRAKLSKAGLVTNPGCYPTAAILGLAPLVSIHSENLISIIIDAKSGVTGAGKKASVDLIFGEVNENFKAYKVFKHQHTPEIEQYLSHLAEREVSVAFVPHLLPVNCGILETIYVHFKKRISPEKAHALYHKFYKTEPFVRVYPLGEQPELKNVIGTNFCDMGLAVSPEGRLLVITSVIDNLIKGAAGQAVQNMNIMCGFDERAGLLTSAAPR
jgi:N-acetyl-gamma-glutamyl-phosphate reductase